MISIVMKDNKVLMIERRDLKGTRSGYVFPGGKVEPDETLRTAAEREVREETGFRCRAERELTKRVHPTTGAKVHYWLCRFVDTDANVVPEFRSLWAPREHLDSMAGPTLAPTLLRELERAEHP